MKNEFKIRFFLTVTAITMFFFLSHKFYFRYDATKQKLYTLSPYTITLLQSLDSTAEITWFKSSDIELFFPEIQYLSDMLYEYELASKKNCITSQKNTKEISEDILRKLGITPKKLETQNSNGTSSKNLYSAIMLEFKGLTKILPFVTSVSNIEYELAKFILEIKYEKDGNPFNGKLYFFSQAPDEDNVYLKSWLEYSGFIIEELKLPFTELDVRIPLFVSGSFIDADSVAAIDVFLRKKGSAVFFVSGNNIDIKGKWTAEPKTKNALIGVLADNGFAIQTDLVLDLANFKLTMTALDGSGYESINYPFWVTLLRENADKESPLFSGVTSLQTFWASSIKINHEKNKNVKVLAQTTKAGILMQPPYSTDPFGNALQLFASEEKEKRTVIAGADNGVSRILVISDENFTGKAIEYTASSSNLDFAVNAAEWICFKDNLLSLKDKKHEILPFKNFENTDEFYFVVQRARIICFIILPILILSASVYILFYFRRQITNE